MEISTRTYSLFHFNGLGPRPKIGLDGSEAGFFGDHKAFEMFAAVHQALGGDHAQVIEQHRVWELVDTISDADLGSIDETMVVNTELIDKFPLFAQFGIADEQHVEPLAPGKIQGDRNQLLADRTGLRNKEHQ